MIITLTANPSVDLTLELDTFTTGEVNRSTGKHKDPAGKGINVARALHKNSINTAAVFPSDATVGSWIESALSEVGIQTVTTRIAEEVRQNITIVDAHGDTTKINEAGPQLSESETAALLSQIAGVLESSPRWLVAAGSLPRGLDGSFYVSLGKLAHEHGVRFAVDTSGGAFAAVAHSGVADLMKPNHEELEELAGRELPTVGDVVEFAQSLLGNPGAAIVVSLGENGALLVNSRGSIWAGHDPVTPDSTVGAGDSTLAGYLSADVTISEELSRHEDGDITRISTAVAWGSAAVQLPATTVPGPKDITITAVHTVINPSFTTAIKELHV
ncbi:1-phosphofructokinase family hexose kinase [uncultured Aurantimicrobium sp.]|uniref:1-phosphofructokinase family hexose kinase n=1 Tax=uncultured Aurantimicrobium sp. TaxID=1705357 RepID=UPI0026180582|nr:1-phosphofructokinase family hexose kinase [uncultured Aurantimicrobium sp.]